MKERFSKLFKSKEKEPNEDEKSKSGPSKKQPKGKPSKKYEDIGIDLGNKNIKISLIDKSNPKYLMANRIYIVEEDLDLKEYFKTVELSIKEFLKENDIKRPSLNFTVPCDDENLITNVFTMNIVEDDLLEDSIMYNIESKNPITRRNYVHRYEVIEKNVEANEMKVISVLLSRDYKEHIIELKETSWKINKLIPQFSLGDTINKREAVLIDFGYKTTRIYLYREEKLEDISIIDIGSKAFLQNTMETFNVDSEEAEAILRDGDALRMFVYGDNGQLAINTKDISMDLVKKLEDITKDISDKLKRNIRVMELNNNTIMNKFLYTGGISNLDEFIEFLSKDINCDMTPLTIYDIKGLRNIGYERDNLEAKDDLTEAENHIEYHFQRNKEEPFIFSMLVPSKEDLTFNFIDGIKFFIDKTAILIGVICATLVLNLGIFFINQRYNDKIDQASRDLSILKDENAGLDVEIGELNENIDRNEIIIDRVENLKAKKKWLSDILYILPGETPTNVGISNIVIEGRHAILTGYSEDYSSVGYLAMALEDYGEVTITEVGEMGSGDLRVENNVKMKKEFKIDIKYEDRLVEED